MLNKVVTARFCLLRAKVLDFLGELVEAEDEALMAYEHAHDIGWAAYDTKAEMPAMLKQERMLAQGWTHGKRDAMCDEAIGVLESR